MTISSITPGTVSVTDCGADDVAPLCDTFSAAFFTDPVMSWCYPDPERRRRVLPETFRAIVAATLPHGGVDTVVDARAGAVWVPPDAAIDGERLAQDLLDVSGDDAHRVERLLELMDAEHPADDAHQYLMVLGTRPEWQSHGLGSALLHAELDPCDEDGMPAYLEATSERNRQLYQRHGFEVTTTVRLPGGPPFWCMWREPQR
jgi:GNAT superfamily N-acetyltransferase